MLRSNTMLGVRILLILAFLDFCNGDGCALRIERNQEALLEIFGNNLSIVCNASCFGPLPDNQLAWYNPYNERVQSNDRVFSLTYNRGRNVRLFILNAQPSDRGTYACAGRIGETTVRDVININIIDRESSRAREVETVYDDGPRRGDVRVPESRSNLPKRRPARSVHSRHRRQVGETTVPTDGSGSTSELSTDSDSASTEVTPTEVTQTEVTPTEVTQTEVTQAEVTSTEDPSDVTSTEITSSGDSTIETFNTGSSAGDGHGSTVGTGDSTATDSSLTTTDGSSDNTSPASTDMMSTDPSGGTTVPPPAPRADTTTGKTATSTKTTMKTTMKTIMKTTKTTITLEPKCDYNTTKIIIVPQKTAFGRYGLIAFAITLSVAFLLLYTLILLHVILPRCCRNRRSVNFRSEVSKMESGPTVIDAVALKPLVVEPTSPEMGFTTVDLDDPKPEDKTDGQNNKPVSPSSPSEPQSPSKFVTTFTIGRKPSTTEGDAIFLHEGKQGETITVVPEVQEAGKTMESEDKDGAKSEDKDGAKSEEKDGTKEKSSEEVPEEKEVDTSKDTSMDTSTDSVVSS